MCLLIPLKKKHKMNDSNAEDIYKEYLSVAKEDVEVYKILVRDGGDLLSPYERSLYELGKKYKSEFSFAEHATSNIGFTRLYNHLSVHKGLHSYSSIDAACKDVSYEYDEVICRFVIPKGALVFQEGEEVCSNEYRFAEILAYADN